MNSVNKVWNLLKRTYNENGYELDESKSGLSMHKATYRYLGLSSASGVDLPPGLKTAAKGGWINPFGSTALTDVVDRLKGYAKSEQNNPLPPEDAHWFYTSCALTILLNDIAFSSGVSIELKALTPGLVSSLKELTDKLYHVDVYET